MSKRVSQENKARQIFRKRNIFDPWFGLNTGKNGPEKTPYLDIFLCSAPANIYNQHVALNTVAKNSISDVSRSPGYFSEYSHLV